MNNELTQLYEGLHPHQLSQLLAEFAEAPKMLRMLDLLANKVLINTNKAVGYIYEQELQDTERAVLTNRFYKLRQKLKDSLLLLLKDELSKLLPEEEELAFVRMLLSRGQYSMALQRLKVLEQACWEQNLFELLPRVFDLAIRAIISIEPLDKEALEVYLQQKNHSEELQQVLQFIVDYKHQMHVSLDDYPKMMQQIRNKIKPYKEDYPRLNMLYHFVGFNIGIYWEAKFNEFKSTPSRHLNQFYKLKEQYPDMPLLYLDEDSRKRLEVKALAQEIVYWYLKGNFDKVQDSLHHLMTYSDYLAYFNEADLQNMTMIAINTTAFDIARKFIADMEYFQKIQFDHDSDVPYYCYELLMYCKAFPEILTDTPRILIQKVMQRMEKDSPLAAWVYDTLSIFCIIYGELDKAAAMAKHPVTAKLFKDAGIPVYAEKLVFILKKKHKAALEALCEELEAACEDKSTRQSIIIHYQGIIKIGRYFLQNRGQF